MGLSARRLGEIIGLTSQETNVLLKEEGFLDGTPGDYYPTEKGKQYVTVKGDDNGYGGYAYRGWNWLEWADEIIDAVKVSPERKNEIRELTAEQRRQRRKQYDGESKAYVEKIEQEKFEESSQDSENFFAKMIVEATVAAGGALLKRLKEHKNDSTNSKN